MSRDSDPLAGYRFLVEFGGVAVAGFHKVTGLERETTVEEFREGGTNDFVHKLAGVSKYPNLTLVRGVSMAKGSDSLWSWHQDVIEGFISRQNVSIVLQDFAGSEQWRWVCSLAYPVKWTGTELDANQNTVFAETVELVHQGVRRVG